MAILAVLATSCSGHQLFWPLAVLSKPAMMATLADLAKPIILIHLSWPDQLGVVQTGLPWAAATALVAAKCSVVSAAQLVGAVGAQSAPHTESWPAEQCTPAAREAYCPGQLLARRKGASRSHI